MSILRSSKFLKDLVSIHKSITVSFLKTPVISACPSRFLRQAIASTSSIDKYIQKLDQDVRRTGRVSKKEIDSTLSELHNSKVATSSQSLMIIRCCGSLLPEESPEDRTRLVQEIWQTLEKMGVSFDISHYNALLRVYIENEYNFIPTEFLAELQSKGIEPNRVTYQRLISAYCQRGDIEGATKILEFMKDKQMPVNENVFSSLINGHFQADDCQSALGILNVMKQANITPTADTYTVLMCGYAKTGDINAINGVLTQCDAEEVDISHKNLLEVIYTLAINGHTQSIDKILKKIQTGPGYNQDAKNTILGLIVKGEDSAAFKILRSMTPAITAEGDPVPAGNFLIKQMVKCQRPLEQILSVCKELKDSNDNGYGLSVATEASFSTNNPYITLKLLSAMSKDHEMCQHYYWPVLVQFGKSGDLQGMKNTLIQMVSEMGVAVNGETLRDFVAPYLPEGEQGVLEMRKANLPIATATAAIVGHLLIKNQLKAAANLALKFRANYSSMVLTKQAVSAYVNTNDLQSFVTLIRIILDNLKEEAVRDPRSVADRILLDAVNSIGKDNQKLNDLLQGFHDMGIGISSEAAEKILDLLPGNKLTSEISTLLSKLTSPDLPVPEMKSSPTKLPRMPRFNNDEGSILAAIKTAESRGESTLSLKRQLLGLYCVNKQLEKAELFYKELQESGFQFVTGSLVQMMDLYTNVEKLPEAVEMYHKIFEKSDGENQVEIDPIKLIKLGGLMIKEGKLDDAFQLFDKHKGDTSFASRGFNTNSACWRLLNNLTESKDPDLVRNVFDKLVECKLMEANNVTLGPLIKVHILRDDIDSALAQFEECCQKYRATPWKNEIACKLIQKEDPILLQKLTDLSTDIHGEINSLYDLVLSFIECGRVRQARKILETPGLRLRNQRINSACERYNNEGKVNYLENLVEATKDLNHIDRSDIYYHLLLSYCKTDDVDKALGLWTQMQDEDVQPSDAFLAKLGKLLEHHQRSVPFSIPNVQEKDLPELINNSRSSVPSSKTKEFRKIMNSRSVDEALESMSKLDENDLSNGDRSKLLNLLVNNGRVGEATKILLDWLKKGLKPNLRVISLIMNELAKNGDIDTFNTLGNAFDEELKRKTSFTNRHAHCMVEAGRVNELLDSLENAVKAARTPSELKALEDEFPRGGIFSVLENAPASIPRVEEVAKLYLDKGILIPYNALWAHYFSNGNFEKAEEFWKHVKKEERLMFQPILKHIRGNKNVALAWDLLNLFKSSQIPAPQLGPVYGVLIDVENASGNLPECERILEEAQKDAGINTISRGSLIRLKKSLEAAGRSLKYTLPPRKSRRDDTSSSSSSDSESDSESAKEPRARA